MSGAKTGKMSGRFPTVEAIPSKEPTPEDLTRVKALIASVVPDPADRTKVAEHLGIDPS